MASKKKLAATAAATFGGAFSALYTAPELQADLIPITFSTSVLGTSAATNVSMIEVGETLLAWNTPGSHVLFPSAALSIGLVSVSQTLNPATFTPGNGSVSIASGDQHVGFTFGGNTGWFKMNLSSGIMTIGPGQYGSMGESVHVPVPEPSSFAFLGLLAAGAGGVMALKKYRKDQPVEEAQA